MKVNHLRIFLHALRTAIIIVAGFIAYDVLKELEKIWNIAHPNKQYNFSKKQFYKLTIIFTIDLVLLYLFVYILRVEM